MQSSRCKSQPRQGRLQTNTLQGLEEAHFLLFCRHIHQLQLPCDRPLQDIQNQNLDVRDQSGVLRYTNSLSQHASTFWCAWNEWWPRQSIEPPTSAWSWPIAAFANGIRRQPTQSSRLRTVTWWRCTKSVLQSLSKCWTRTSATSTYRHVRLSTHVATTHRVFHTLHD